MISKETASSQGLIWKTLYLSSSESNKKKKKLLIMDAVKLHLETVNKPSGNRIVHLPISL